ncbi:MAG: hypothetical protein ACO3B4_09695 [Burkholderiaceae bacterium]
MLSGRLDGVGPSPVQHNRVWLAALILAVWTGNLSIISGLVRAFRVSFKVSIEAPYSSRNMIELWRRLYMVGGGVSNLLLVMTLSGGYT